MYAETDIRRQGAETDDDTFIALTHTSGVRSHLYVSATTAQLGPRFRVLGSRAGYVKYGLDPQEAALREGRRPGTAADWGTEAESVGPESLLGSPLWRRVPADRRWPPRTDPPGRLPRVLCGRRQGSHRRRPQPGDRCRGGRRPRRTGGGPPFGPRRSGGDAVTRNQEITREVPPGAHPTPGGTGGAGTAPGPQPVHLRRRLGPGSPPRGAGPRTPGAGRDRHPPGGPAALPRRAARLHSRQRRLDRPQASRGRALRRRLATWSAPASAPRARPSRSPPAWTRTCTRPTAAPSRSRLDVGGDRRRSPSPACRRPRTTRSWWRRWRRYAAELTSTRGGGARERRTARGRPVGRPQIRRPALPPGVSATRP